MKKSIRCFAAVIAACALAGGAFYGGIQYGTRSVTQTDKAEPEGNTEEDTEEDTPEQGPFAYSTFYASVDSIDGRSLSVTGLDVNDINGRGEFFITLADDAPVMFRGTSVPVDSITEGEIIEVIYDSLVLESYPAIIYDVAAIKILSDR